jgi:hypothetical protein
VVLADGEDDGFAELAADGVAQAIFEEGFAETAVGGFEKKRFSKLALLEALPSGPRPRRREGGHGGKPSSDSSWVVTSLRASTTSGVDEEAVRTPSSSE